MTFQVQGSCIPDVFLASPVNHGVKVWFSIGMELRANDAPGSSQSTEKVPESSSCKTASCVCEEHVAGVASEGGSIGHESSGGWGNGGKDTLFIILRVSPLYLAQLMGC